MARKRAFRASQRLKNDGVSEAKQHIIYGICTDDERTPSQDALIRSICRLAGGTYSEELYRFLTDDRIDHNYIYINYGLRPNDLFIMKRRFYLRFRDRLSRQDGLNTFVCAAGQNGDEPHGKRNDE